MKESPRGKSIPSSATVTFTRSWISFPAENGHTFGHTCRFSGTWDGAQSETPSRIFLEIINPPYPP